MSGRDRERRTPRLHAKAIRSSATLLAIGALAVVAAATAGTGSATPVDASGPDSWSAAGILTTARVRHTSSLLAGGDVLVAGGEDAGILASVERYNPATDSWSGAASLTTARHSHTATLLPNGKVLVAGGYGMSGALASSEIYDPVADTWSPAGSLASARFSHTATLLPDGRVLVAGGGGSSGWVASAEIYDPVTDAWSPAGSMAADRYYHTATLLPGGNVLVAGGYGSAGVLAGAEIYDVGANTWSATASLGSARWIHTATLLSTGKVLVAGGNAGGALSSAELYDPVADTWSPAGSLAAARYVHTAKLLSGGKVLVAGGAAISGALDSAEIYDPTTDSWSPADNLLSARYGHAASRLSNGTVLVTGGSDGTDELSSAEIFDPAPASDISGFWHIDYSGGPPGAHCSVQLTEAGAAFSGPISCINGATGTVSGTVSGDQTSGVDNPIGPYSISHAGTLTGDVWTGQWRFCSGCPAAGGFVASRIPASYQTSIDPGVPGGLTTDPFDNTEVIVAAGVAQAPGLLTLSLQPITQTPAGYYPLRTAYVFGPSPQAFNAPGVQVVFHYTAADLASAGSAANIRVYVSDTQAVSGWSLVGGTVDTNAMTITVSLMHFSTHGLFVPANPALDGDADGCTAAEELGPSPALGGQRDPLDSWDFFDVTGDQSIDISDALDVLEYFGDPGTSAAGNLRDRDNIGAAQPWRTYEADGGVDITDALVSLQSFGHSCSAAP